MTKSPTPQYVDECPKEDCPVSLKSENPYPVVTQILFGLSFFLFLIYHESIINFHPFALWIWSGIQILLGLLLLRGRMKARKKGYRCLRCNAVERGRK